MNTKMEVNLEKKGLSSVLLIMVCIYIFLVIERPWESIRYLEGIPIERAYAILLIIVAFLQHKFKISASPTNKWVYGLLGLHFLLAPFAFNPSFAVEQGVEYAKMVVLYLLMLAVADDEESLKLLIKAYVFSTMLYALHSFWEYSNGRHVWRMGIARMVGVDSTLSDPNSFGATIVLSLPFAYALLRAEIKQLLVKLYYMYFALAVVCIVLTGSRTAFLGLIVLILFWALHQQGALRAKMIIVALLSIGTLWVTMPAEKQKRIRTLWAEEENTSAHNSALGRLTGWKVSWEMFKQKPFTGVGTGGKNFIGYRRTHDVDKDAHQYENLATALQSHVLYGQVLAEQGVFGAILFLGLVASIARSAYMTRRVLTVKANNLYLISNAILTSLALLLFMGFGGHNFYRPLWLWLAAWSGTLYMLAMRKIDAHH